MEIDKEELTRKNGAFHINMGSAYNHINAHISGCADNGKCRRFYEAAEEIYKELLAAGEATEGHKKCLDHVAEMLSVEEIQ